MRWFWALYKTGGIPELKSGLSSDEFIQQFVANMNASFQELYIMEARVDGLFRPVGAAMLKNEGYVSFPSFAWFPKVSARNKIEAVVKFVDDFRKSPSLYDDGPTRRLGVMYAHENDKNFAVHIAKYGIIRRVGTIFDAFGDNENASVFQTRKP